MSTENDYRYSILCISDHNFGVEIDHVKEVIPMPKITRVPNVHPSVLGVFNLRGQIYSVIDIRKLLNLEVIPNSSRDFVVLIEQDDFSCGVIVNRVLDVLRIDSTKIQLPTRDMSPNYTEYLNGFFEHKKLGLIYFLDVKAITETKEINKYRYV